ncbi:MAG: isoprenoid biosynthesis protein ElbB [Bdellovibrio sp. CG10_big_fil_rev_8_21_14_0_10_47_8]|nr:MAG: isoprenoid biosynthesis protein ElbB [Bdellovibrio sp. CG10_big_fil_rev_8_21_14_0_10_47_8]
MSKGPAKKIAVVLSGCGNKDGTEITEAVSLMIGLSAAGADIQYFAPDLDITAQNFLTGQPLAEKRNLMSESARITRSQIKDLKELRADDFDGLAFPGGFGAALHLSTWAKKGSQCTVLPEVEKTILDFHRQSKPIAAICIAPTLLAKVLGSKGVTLTIGNDVETSAEIKKTGALPVDCPVDDFITDREHKVITTPAYMYNAQPHQVFQGISGLVKEFIEMA